MVLSRKKFYLLTVLLLAAGIAICAYPFISSWINKRSQAVLIENCDKIVAQYPDSKNQALLASARKFNKELYKITKGSFGFISTDLDKEYWKVLDVGNGLIGYLEIPKIDVMLPIEHGTSQETLSNAVGHLEGTSLPVGGKNTHCVLSGHRGLPSSTLFTNITELKTGDIVFIHVAKETLAYQVFQILTVLPEDNDSLNIRSGEDLLTLLTCTPYGINSHRLLVQCKRIPYSPEKAAQVRSAKNKVISLHTKIMTGIIAAGLLIIILILIFVPRYYKNHAGEKEET